MTEHDWLEAFSCLLLLCILFVILVEAATEMNPFFARFKWSFSWYAARYLAIICGVILAISVLLEEE